MRNAVPSFLITTLFLLMVSCSGLTSQRQGGAVAPAWILKYDRPVSVAVMPFVNLTSEPGLDTLVREGFYNHFSSKNYRDIELGEVDRIIEARENNDSPAWKGLSPADLGDLFHADFIILGKVLEYKKFFAGIYSQIALNVELEMVECKSGEGVWRKTMIKRSHDGGLPFDLFGIVPAALRSGLHMKQERTMDLIDRINRDLTALIPSPPAPALTGFSVDIQVASFLEETLALKTLKEFEEKGLRARIETVTMKGRLWHRLLLGPYDNRPEAEEVLRTLEKETKFKPFFIHRFPEARQKGT
jgi:hypothetical protein